MQQGWTGEMLKSTVANIDKLKNYSPDRAVVAPLFASIAEEDKRNKAIDAAMTRLRVDFQKSLATTPLSEIAKMDDASVVRVHSNFTQSWALAGKDPIFAPVVQDKTRPEPSLIDRVLKKVQAGLLLDRVKAVAKVLNNQYVGMGLAADAFTYSHTFDRTKKSVKLLRLFRLEGGLKAGFALSLAGAAAFVYLFFSYLEKLPSPNELIRFDIAVLAAYFFLLGVQMVFLSFLLSLFYLKVK
jgi:hypothetical protein